MEARPVFASHRQAGPLHAHAVAHGDTVKVERRGVDAQFQIAALIRQRGDSARRYNDSAKHNQGFFGMRMRRRSPPMRCTSLNSNVGREPGGPSPLTCINGAASAPRSAGAMYNTNSSTRFD